VLFAVSLLSRVALAEEVDDGTRNAARDLASQGKASFTRGDFQSARDLFHRAYTLVPAPTIAVYEARALVKMNRLVEAEEAYMRAVRTRLDAASSEQFRDAVSNAENELVALRPAMPKLTIVTTGPGANHPGLRVSLDGTEVKRAILGVEISVDPGAHTLVGRVPGGADARAAFSIAERAHQRVELVIPEGSAAGTPLPGGPLSTPSAQKSLQITDSALPESGSGANGSTQRTLSFVVAGVGVAGLTTGIVTGLLAGTKHSHAEDLCENHVCAPGSAGADAVDSFRSLRTVSTIGYVVGAAGLAGGAVLYFTAKKTDSAPMAYVRAYVGANALGVAGAF
jgi:tetratricopeptide (TPR) repeat protein